MENLSFKIGNVEIKNPVVLAPMAGLTTSAYRKIAKDMGCALVYSELISDKAIVYNNEKTLDLLKFSKCERPIAIQLFGSEIDSMVSAAKYIEENFKPDIIDINMGCPVPKVAIKNNAGSALMKNPEHVFELVKSIVESVKVPVTVKIRSGWDSSSINAVEIAQICESAGASAIAVHARTRSDGYSGNADWNIIKDVVKNVNVPVIGNGDIKSGDDALKMMEMTKCQGVMIGRAILGNPWLIKECVDVLNNKDTNEIISVKERIEMLKKHYLLLLDDYPEIVATLQMRTHALYYLKYLPNTKEIKLKICQAKTKEEFLNIINDYENKKV